MWKFFVKAFALIMGVSVIFNLLGPLGDRVAPLEDWRVEHRQRIETLESKLDRIEAITLGNSHSDALDYVLLRTDGQSLAFAAADLFEVEQYAAYISNRLPSLKTVWITVSYYSFSRDNATFEPFRTRRIRFYSMVPAWSPIQGDIPNFVLGRLESYTHIMSVVRSDGWEGVWAELANSTPAANLPQYDGVVTTSVWGTCSHYTAAQLESHARDTAYRNVTSSSQMAVVHQGLEQDAFNALARTIERLRAKGTSVILFTPTYHESYNAYFMEQGALIYQDMKRKMDALQQSYRVPYYDFSNDPEIAVHPELFYNSDHLGDCGRMVFTQKLLEAMHDNSD
jgi:hypothetical protein